MLNIFTSQKVRSRMKSGPMGPYLSEIAAVLCNQGYARSTIRLHLRAADQFGAWLLKEGVSINDISTSTVDRYLEGLDRQYSQSCLRGRLSAKALGVKGLVEFLGLQAVWAQRPYPGPRSSARPVSENLVLPVVVKLPSPPKIARLSRGCGGPPSADIFT